MKRILAISGGVDSMVMLHLFAEKYPPDELVVAHFNHHIRDNSDEDAEFVRRIAAEKGLEFQLGTAELGTGASESAARSARYDFLYSIAPADSKIYTAHHTDDLTESVLINLIRGTGWRGLAVLDSGRICRPFLTHYTEFGFKTPPDKTALLRIAGERNLHFREDQSNSSDEYLRNRLRHEMHISNETKQQIFSLWQKQTELKRDADALVAELLPARRWPRAEVAALRDSVAQELLRAACLRAGIPATRPQLQDFLSAIRTYAPGKSFNLPGDHLIKLQKSFFYL